MFIAAWLCMILASGVIFASPAYIAIGAPIGLAGAVLFMLAFARVEEPKPMSKKDIREWSPDVGELPKGAEGSIMYRIDTTLDEPVRTSVLCGKCGELTWTEGKRPQIFTCPGCDTLLWDKPEDDEEEDSMVSLDELDAYPTAEEE
ncbi:MAG: hypothetical protein CXT67_07320 [Methanobacteriota archaeon]|nr:MAG: hypothetical protein CXT67_07320 [Euryarchaeota archaeon]